MFKSINPFTEELFFEAPTLSTKEIASTLSKVDISFKKYRNTNFIERTKALHSIAHDLLNNKQDYALTITQEMGKPISQSVAEIEKCAGICSYYADNSEKFLADQQYASSFSTSFIRHEPLGALLAVMPWNFPFWQVFRFLAPALMSGNIALLKHAPNVGLCATTIEKIVNKYFDQQVLFNLFIDVKDVEKFIASNEIKAVTLTGSEYAGSAVAALAGANLKKCVLELGGSDPFIVLPDADLEKTVDGAIASRFSNAGQSCIAAKRFIIHKDLKHEFVKLLEAKISAFTIGDPSLSSTFMGPLARIDLKEKLNGQISKCIKLGDKISSYNKAPNHGFFSQPCIIDDIHPTSPAVSEEFFGPVVSLFDFETEEEAIEIANNTPYGLGASVWTKDTSTIGNFITNIDAGSVFVNDFVKSSYDLPFGGIKKSGYGRELSDLGIKEFVNTKTVVIAD